MTKADADSSSPRPPLWDPEERRLALRRRIRELQTRSSRGLWWVCLFLAVSVAARYRFAFVPSLSPGLRDLLGRPPPLSWISGALVIYSFSALALTFGRMGSAEPRDGPAHVGYLTAFYGFYHLADGLSENFWAVLVAGLTILGLQAYAIWTYNAELLREECELLRAVEERGESPGKG